MYDIEAYRFPPFRGFVNHGVVSFIFPFVPVKILFTTTDAFVHHDPFEPSAKLNRVFQLPQVFECQDKSILQNVFCIVAVPRHPRADVEHALAILLV